MKILVTGSSGYVGSALCEKLSTSFDVIGVDCLPGKYTDYVYDIGEKINKFNSILSNGDIVINCAAIRFDFGITAKEYYTHNVDKHIQFLKNIENIDLSFFLHISSLAVLDGENIPYKKELNCDDAYKATKYIQGNIIKNEMNRSKIKYAEVLPSAIYHNTARDDTNIGKLQQFSKYLPFISKISKKLSKSLFLNRGHLYRFFISKLTSLGLKLYPNQAKKLLKDTEYSQYRNINEKYKVFNIGSNQTKLKISTIFKNFEQNEKN